MLKCVSDPDQIGLQKAASLFYQLGGISVPEVVAGYLKIGYEKVAVLASKIMKDLVSPTSSGLSGAIYCYNHRYDNFLLDVFLGTTDKTDNPYHMSSNVFVEHSANGTIRAEADFDKSLCRSPDSMYKKKMEERMVSFFIENRPTTTLAEFKFQAEAIINNFTAPNVDRILTNSAMSTSVADTVRRQMSADRQYLIQLIKNINKNIMNNADNPNASFMNSSVFQEIKNRTGNIQYNKHCDSPMTKRISILQRFLIYNGWIYFLWWRSKESWTMIL